MAASENNTGVDTPETRVIELIESAIEATNESEKVSLLMQAQEFIIHRNLLDQFVEDMLGFQNDRSAEVRKFVAGFIETTCKKVPAYFPKLTNNLKMFLADEVANVLKKTIQVSTQLYKVFLVWLSNDNSAEETGGAASALVAWSEIKKHISALIDSTENDGIRTQCIKFIETVIICQTKRDTFSPENDFSLDQVIETENQLIDTDALEEEAMLLFEQLVSFQAKIHISSVNLMATMQSLSLVARQRSKLFFNKVVEAFEALSANLPPTLAKSQVNSVNKQMKLLFLTLFKHPYVYSTKQHPKLSQTLLNVGATQSEINRCLSDVRKRGIKTELPHPSEAKRIKLEPTEDGEENSSSNSTGVSANGTPPPPTFPPLPSFNMESALHELSKKFSRHDSAKAADITAKDLLCRLSNINMACDLVLSSIHLFPEQMNDTLRSSLAEASKPNAASEIAKHLSMQFTAAGIGPGVEEITVKYVNMFAVANKVKVDPEITKKVHSIVKKCIAKEMKKHEAHHKAKLTQTGKSMALNTAAAATATSTISAAPVAPTATKAKTFNLSEITKPLDGSDKFKYMEGAVIRILTEDKSGHFSSKQFETRHKILGKLLSDFSSFESLKSLIKDYIFKDIRNRFDILLNMLYIEYVTGKQNSSLDYYASCLLWVMQNIINTCETKDRDFFLHKFCTETPLLTENVHNLLKSFILFSPDTYPDCASSGITLAKALIQKRPKHRINLLNILLHVCTESTNSDAQKIALDAIKELYQDEALHLSGNIEEFTLRHLNMLLNDVPQEGIPGVKDGSWSEDAIKSCLSLYLLLLPQNQKLIHHLPAVFTSSNPTTKRTILKYIHSAIETLDMNSPEVLRLVETCPEGTEPMISRIIHILTAKKPPSAELISRVRELYQKRISDVRFLIPVLTGFSKKEIIALLPQLIKLNPNVVKEVFNRLLSSHVDQSSFTSPISPADLLIALHNIDLSKCDLKTVMKATNLCFEEKNIYTAEVLAVVMQMLIEQNPLPTLLMRTVIQTLINFPRLITFIMNNILQKLIVKQVWTQKKVWEGFIKCCQRTMPQSFAVLLQLPHAQLKSVFETCPEIRPLLATHLQSLNEQQSARISQTLLDLVLVPAENAN